MRGHNREVEYNGLLRNSNNDGNISTADAANKNDHVASQFIEYQQLSMTQD